MRFSIRAKIVSVSIFFISIGGILATYLVFDYTRISLIDLRKESLGNNNKESIKETELVLGIAEKAVESISKNESVVEFLYLNDSQKDSSLEESLAYEDGNLKEESEEKEESASLDREELEKELAEINLGNIFDIIYLTDADGNVLVSTDRTLLGNNYSFRDYFKEAVNEGSFVDFSVGVTTKKAGYYFSRAIRKDGKLLGLVLGKAGTEIIDNTVKNNTSLYDSNLMLVDKFGVVIYSNKPERLYKSAGPLDTEDKKKIFDTRRYNQIEEMESLGYDFIIPAIKSRETFFLRDFFDKVDGKNEIVTFTKIGKFPFYFISEIEKESLEKTATGVSLILAIIVFSTATTISVIVSYAINIILLPIGELKAVAESIRKKDFSKKASIKTKDELGELGITLNEASDQLKIMYNEMDEKIKERTKTLEETNRFMVGREIRMIELKKEMENLKKELKKKQTKV